MAKTFEECSLDAIARITSQKAEGSDIALTFIMSEFIDVVGLKRMRKMIPALEAKFAKAQAEYLAGHG